MTLIRCQQLGRLVRHPRVTTGIWSSLSASLTSTRTLGADDAPALREHRVSVRTCGALYRQWRKTKPEYRDAPEDGVVVDIPFVFTRWDDGGGSGGRRPLAVVLHGAPGGYGDFSENLVPRLRAAGVDVLVPNLPGMAFSLQNKFFWHSIEERTALLKDFLKEMNITRIDALVAHSAAIFPSLRITLEEPGAAPAVKSLALLAPNSILTPKTLEPLWLTRRIVRAYRRFPLLRPLVGAVVRTAHSLGLSPLKPVVEDFMLSVTTYLESRYAESSPLLEAVSLRRLPTLVAISRDDRLLPYPVLLAVCTTLGAGEEDMWCFGPDGQLRRPGKPDSWLKVVCFDKGSHYPFIKQPDVCADEILQLLRRIGSLS
ncbi:uncharacterized protein ISCGN_025373 [Ixodes scapularis]